MNPYPGERHQCLLVRRNPRHAVIAHVSGLPGRALRLLRLTPVDGHVPDANHLLDEHIFENRRAVRQAVLGLMRAIPTENNHAY